jgi:hypothetical protein
MDIFFYLVAGLAIGTFIGWLLGRSKSRVESEKKNVLIQQQYVELEKEFVGYRATQTATLNNAQELLTAKLRELGTLQQSIKEGQMLLNTSGAELAAVKADLRAVNHLIQEKQKGEELLKEELRLTKQELSTASQATCRRNGEQRKLCRKNLRRRRRRWRR